MLIQFNVTNCYSFKNESVLTMQASSDDTFQQNLIKCGKKYILPAVAIYGANAAGKSNLMKAFTAAIMFIRQSNMYQINARNPIVPFAFDDMNQDNKTRFDFSFCHNGAIYEYGFTATNEIVYEEYLYEYKTQKPSLVFERTNINTYRYTAANKRELSQYEEKTSPNKLFLATATAWNCELTRNAFMWFAEGIDTYSSESLNNAFIGEFEQDNSPEMKQFMLDFIHYADINISDYSFEIKDADTIPAFLNPDNVNIQQLKQWKLDVVHDIKNEDGINHRYIMPFSSESAGTIKAFSYGPIIRNALMTGKTIIVDEIDSCLHPMLTKYLIELFTDSTLNPNGAQLIFSTHDITLLDQDIFRRDQIYFVEKSNSTGMSSLYSLNDYSPRKSENIRKGYLQGRYGAIPSIIPGGFKWQKK